MQDVNPAFARGFPIESSQSFIWEPQFSMRFWIPEEYERNRVEIAAAIRVMGLKRGPGHIDQLFDEMEIPMRERVLEASKKHKVCRSEAAKRAWKTRRQNMRRGKKN